MPPISLPSINKNNKDHLSNLITPKTMQRELSKLKSEIEDRFSVSTKFPSITSRRTSKGGKRKTRKIKGKKTKKLRRILRKRKTMRYK